MRDARFHEPFPYVDPTWESSAFAVTKDKRARSVEVVRRTEAKETAQPFDHPWRAAQHAAFEALEVAWVLRVETWRVLVNIEESGHAGRQTLLPVHRAFMGRLRDLQVKVSNAFAIGLRLVRAQGRSQDDLFAIARLKPRQVSYVLSPKRRPDFDPRLGDKTPLDDPCWDYEVGGWDSDYDLPVQLQSNVTSARECARDVIASRLEHNLDTDRLMAGYLDCLRFATQAREDIELAFIGALHLHGHSWADIGATVHMTTQGAHSRYSSEVSCREFMFEGRWRPTRLHQQTPRHE